MWPSLKAAVPTAPREYLSRTRAYHRRVGPVTVEACFQDLLLAGKQVEESPEDEKRAQQMQQERQRTGNSSSGAGKTKRKPAQQTTTGAGVQKRKRGPRKPKNTDAVSETATTTKPAGKAKGKRLSKAEQDKLKVEKKCFNCKKVVHMANDCPEKAGAPKADGGSAVVKVIRADGGDDLMNYGAIPDSPQHSSIDARMQELSDGSILNQSYDDSANIRVVNVVWAGKLVGEMEKELGLDMDVDMDGFPLSTNGVSNSVDVISSSFPNVNVDISNVFHSLSSISLVGKGKRKAEETVMVSNKCTKMDAEEAVVLEEKKIGNGGQ